MEQSYCCSEFRPQVSYVRRNNAGDAWSLTNASDDDSDVGRLRRFVSRNRRLLAAITALLLLVVRISARGWRPKCVLHCSVFGLICTNANASASTIAYCGIRVSMEPCVHAGLLVQVSG